MATPIFNESFFHDGRGPELMKVHWGSTGTSLRALDYINPDGGGLRHVLVLAAQVVMVTPEEVIDYGTGGDPIRHHERAAIFDMGRSAWLESFSPRHLVRCKHFKLFFYDDLFDIIAEGVECRVGGFQDSEAGSAK